MLFMLLLGSCHKHIATRTTGIALVKATRFLHDEYVPDWFFWEVIEMARKIFLTSFVLVIPEPLRAIVAMLVSFSYILFLVLARPYKDTVTMFIAVAVNFSLTCAYLAAMLSRQLTALSAQFSTSAHFEASVWEVVGFTSITGPGVLIVLANSIVLVILLGITTLQISRERHMSTLRVRAQRAPPELTLDGDEKFHVFLSHIWRSGQDQAASIKRMLTLLLPSIRIFLDVDDLEDIGNLRKYVQHSHAFLVFLSDGYFDSENCLKEVDAAVDLGKPIVLMHEADQKQGKVDDLSELALRCPAKYRQVLFGADEAPFPRLNLSFEAGTELQSQGVINALPSIPFHRMRDFQLISLRLIASSILNIPYTSLVVPGELTEFDIWVPKVQIHTSRYNKGAEAVAHELKLKCVNPSNIDITTDPFQQDGLDGVQHWQFLYLNTDTFVDKPALSEDIRKLPHFDRMILIHECDPAHGGCPFQKLLDVTPTDLKGRYLYSKLAIPWQPSPHKEASIRLALKAIGARAVTADRVIRSVANLLSSSMRSERLKIWSKRIERKPQPQRLLQGGDFKTDSDCDTVKMIGQSSQSLQHAAEQVSHV